MKFFNSYSKRGNGKPCRVREKIKQLIEMEEKGKSYTFYEASASPFILLKEVIILVSELETQIELFLFYDYKYYKMEYSAKDYILDSNVKEIIEKFTTLCMNSLIKEELLLLEKMTNAQFQFTVKIFFKKFL